MSNCQICGRETRVKNDRFCVGHKEEYIELLNENGYFTPKPKAHKRRSEDMMENTCETKFGFTYEEKLKSQFGDLYD